jgi:POT family proton-dependent oligopeptide transporter
MLWCFITPILGAVIADQHLGRMRTITYASVAYIAGLAVLVASSRFDAGASLLGLLLAMALVGVGTGGIRPNVNSLVAEQYQPPTTPLRKLASGEVVLI